MDKSSSVVVFSAFFDPWMSGAERFALEVADRIGRSRRVTVVTARLSRRVSRFERRAHYDIIRVGFGSRIDKWLFPILAPLWVVGGKPPEIVHAVMESYAGIALLVYKFFRPRSRTVLTLQSGDLDSTVKQQKIPSWLWQRIHASPDAVTAISQFLADRAIRLGAAPARVSVIPNGVDLARLTPRSESNRVPHRIVCIARLSWEKGLPTLLAALANVRRAIPDAHLVLVGDGPLRQPLMEDAERLGVSDAVTFRGALPHDEALAVLKTADIFVCPSLAEGLGIVFIEAQACGVPAIGTRVGGIPDVIEDGVTGLLVPPDDADALGDAIRRSMYDAALTLRLVTSARDHLARFSWDRIAQQVLDVYKRLSESRVLIAASIYPPDPGGPATLAAFIADRMHADVVVRRALSLPRFAWRLWRAARRADILFAQDASATAVVAAFIAARRHLPFVVRLGGDLLWERAAEEDKATIGLADYYSSGAYRKTSFARRCMLGFILRSASRVIYPNDWLPRLYASVGLSQSSRQVIICNPSPSLPVQGVAIAPRRQLVIAGRLVYLKNIIPTLEVAARVRKTSEPFDILIAGDGPLRATIDDWIRAHAVRWVRVQPTMGRDALLREISQSLAVLQASWSEVSPNIPVESLSLGTPVLLTRENGNRDLFEGYALQIDPRSSQAIEAGIRELVSHDGQARWRDRARSFRWPQSVEGMMEHYSRVFNGLSS